MKKHQSVGSLVAQPFRWVWHIIAVIWPSRTATFINDGNISYVQQTTFTRFAKATIKAALVIWALWSTYVFIYHRPILQARTAELAAAKQQTAQQFSDLADYYKQFSKLHQQLNTIDDQILNTKKVNATVADDLMRKRLTLWAQLDFLQTKLEGIYTSGNYKPEFTKMSDLMIEKQLTDEENRQVKARNRELESSMIAISDAQNQLLERVDKLASRETERLETYMRKINGTLTSLGLSEKTLVARSKKEKINGTSAPKALEFSDSDKLDERYEKLASKIELWQGLERTKTMLPVGNPVRNPYVTSKFGERTDPIKGIPSMHRGVDFAGQIGTPLYAVAPGRVIKSGDRYGYGKAVEIDHGLGFTTLYGHLSEIRVKQGDFIEAKDVVGLGGNTGRSTGPHLHYEVRYRGVPFNPYTFVVGQNIEY